MTTHITIESYSDLVAYDQQVEATLPEIEGAAGLCSVYQVARPGVALLAGLPLIPNGLKKVLKLLLAALDVHCGTLATYDDLVAYDQQLQAALLQADLQQVAAAAELCKVYQLARPGLALLAGLPLIPSAVLKVLKLLLAALDAHCGI